MLAKVRAYAELLRVSNVLTTVADVWMGMIVAAGSLAPAAVCVPLTAASVLLYLSGMVLNDVFDVAKDSGERPTRPIPSGRVSLREAGRFGWLLLAAGLAAAATVSVVLGRAESFLLAACLALWVVLYNRYKSGPGGPLLMGMCRATNVALGLAAGGAFFGGSAPTRGHLAAAALLYVMGLTYFARREAQVNQRGPLAGAAALSLAGLAVAALLPLAFDSLGPLTVSGFQWLLLWAVVAMLVGRRYAAAILQPTPRHIQSAVGNAIQSIIVIDAAVAWGYAGQFWGLAILALLPPTMLLARLVPQT